MLLYLVLLCVVVLALAVCCCPKRYTVPPKAGVLARDECCYLVQYAVLLCSSVGYGLLLLIALVLLLGAVPSTAVCSGICLFSMLLSEVVHNTTEGSSVW